MTASTVLVTGVPRSGTSFACTLLDGANDTVALSEPLQLAEFVDITTSDTILQHVEHRFREIRAGILDNKAAPTTHVGGSLSDARVESKPSLDGLRRPLGEQGEMLICKPLSAHFNLVIKHNALFAGLLRQLSERYRCVGLVRNPLAVLASWQTVELPVHAGRLPAGEMLDAGLRADLDQESEVLARQLRILDWFFSIYQRMLPPAQLLRYEDLIATQGEVLFRACGLSGGPKTCLKPQNDSERYRSLDIEALLTALVSRDGAWNSLYARGDLEALALTLS